MKEDFFFIDIQDQNTSKVFHRLYYYESVLNLIINFFNHEFIDNDTLKKFMSFLETLEDSEDVYFITTNENYHWAMCIIENSFECSKGLSSKEITQYILFDKEFLRKKKINSYIESVTSQ